ncbi:MAG: hypothetical protein E7474_08555 [Ruminococcaceae bacterium]|nr:hypothetical protein [Oscillospiraceae bacterium]
MAKKPVSRSVLFYKRMIAATLALIIVTLAVVAICCALELRDARGELQELQDKLLELQLQAAEAEAERLQNVIPPEQPKPVGEASAADIIAENTLVAHAMGAAGDVVGLNCLEGFVERYEAGIRVFEADLRMTSDGYVVLRHDWVGGLQEGANPTNIPTREEFLSMRILDKYTPLSFRDLLLLMVQYPDVCIITDTKLLDTEAVTLQFQSMVDEAHSLGLSYLFDRMIVQVYSPEHYAVVDGVYHFPHYIYTLYQDYFGRTEDSFRNKVVFCEENGILGLTLNAEVWDPAYAPIADWHGVRVCVHEIDDVDEAKELLRTGVRAIYTNTLVPADMETDADTAAEND